MDRRVAIEIIDNADEPEHLLLLLWQWTAQKEQIVKDDKGEVLPMLCLICGHIGNLDTCPRFDAHSAIVSDRYQQVVRVIARPARVIARPAEVSAFTIGGHAAVLALLDEAT